MLDDGSDLDNAEDERTDVRETTMVVPEDDNIATFEDNEGLHDDLTGTSTFDIVDLGDGDDYALTGDGNDFILGGAGQDSIDGGLGEDTIHGGAGDDFLGGGDGDGSDWIRGGEGNDVINLGAGLDSNGADIEDYEMVLLEDPENSATYLAQMQAEIEDSDAGNDTISGGAHDDEISDFLGSNLINGQQGSDTIVGLDLYETEGTPDTLLGGHNDDTLIGDDGDVMSGGLDTDRFIVYQSVGNAAVTITDFDPVSEILLVAGDYDTSVTLSFSANGDHAQVMAGDTVLATLENVSVSDLSSDNVMYESETQATP
ncbi:calcium-binding protein [Thalassovita aquimarina]|uniref:Uncharacterized protein n=1 Tax=Thalassovita aquimarina TaxID=2785917 RepID=A0ABS5HT82_9RHOB|nr:hypothetical protein [Thalassovita aquimarina]MBR9652189.1 hypothetical protein [Thalassovita aquimarina]